MQSRTTIISSIATLILAAGVAQAGVTTFDNVNNNNWNDAGNWDNGVPDATDRAVIPEFKTCNVNISAAIADTIDVQGTLVILGGNTLTLENNNDNIIDAAADHSIVDGLLTLAGDDSVLKFTGHYEHGISGGGEIHGNHNNARIEIESEIKFISRLADGGITGAMTIMGIPDTKGTGTFRNDGLVYARGTGMGTDTLELHEDTILEDHSTVHTAIWTSGDGYRAILLFNRDATLNGDFNLYCPTYAGRIHINADIDTCGNWLWDNGTIKIFASQTFRYGSYSGWTTNPGSSISVGCLSWSKSGLYEASGPLCD